MLIRIAGVFWKVIPRGTRTWLTRRFHPTFTVSAAGIIVNDRGEVLLLDHVVRHKNSWGLPGGFINRGEQPDEALRRELLEETGIELTDISLYRCGTRGRHVEIIMTANCVGEAQVNSSEIRQLGWFSIGNMPGEMSEAQQKLIKKALTRNV